MALLTGGRPHPRKVCWRGSPKRTWRRGSADDKGRFSVISAGIISGTAAADRMIEFLRLVASQVRGPAPLRLCDILLSESVYSSWELERYARLRSSCWRGYTKEAREQIGLQLNCAVVSQKYRSERACGSICRTQAQIFGLAMCSCLSGVPQGAGCGSSCRTQVQS